MHEQCIEVKKDTDQKLYSSPLLGYVGMCVKRKCSCICYVLTLNLIETPFNTFANRADPDQTALTNFCTRAA